MFLLMNITLMTSKMIQQFKDQKEYFTKSGRTVYGGGGITPDVIQKNDVKFNESTRKIYFHEDRLLIQIC